MIEPDALSLVAVSPRSRWRKRLLLLGMLLLPPLIVLGVTVYQSMTNERRLQRAIALTDRVDPGWSLQEIERQRKTIPVEKNGVLRVIAARQFMPLPKGTVRLGEDLWNLEPNEQLNDQHIQALRDELARVSSLLSTVRELADLPEGRYALAWSPDFVSTPLPHCDALNTLHYWLWFDLLFRVQEGNIEEGMIAWRAFFNAGRSIGDEPLAMSQLARMSYVRRALYGLERVLAQCSPSEESLADCQQCLGAEETYPSLLIAARGERAFRDQFMQGVQRGEIKLSRIQGFLNGPVRRTGIDVADDLFYSVSTGSIVKSRAALLEYATQFVEIAKLPVEQQSEPIKELEASRQKQPLLVHEFCKFSGLVAERYQLSRAELRSAITAVAAERFRRIHGRWPQTLSELAPQFLNKVPIDPYDGAPLRMRRLEDGFVIYSVGPDQRDNGGVFSPNRLAPAPGTDVGFRLWNVEQRRRPAKPPPATVGDTKSAR